MFIDEIFDSYGGTYVSRTRNRRLKAIQDDDAIVSCGAHRSRKVNRSHMNGIVIYLKCRIDTPEKRLETSFVRPLLKDKPLILLEMERSERYESFPIISS